MDWFLLALVSVLAASVAGVLQRVLMKDERSNPYSYAIVLHFLLGFLNLACALWYGARFSLSEGNLWILLIAGVLWAVCDIFLFKALQLVEVSKLTILSGLRVIITIIASLVLLHETFTVEKSIGTVLILVSTMLVINVKSEWKLDKGLLYTVVMASFAGLGIVADGAGVQHYHPLVYNTIINFLAGLIIFATAPRAFKRWQPLIEPAFIRNMLLIAVFGTIQGIAYLTALSYGGHTAEVGTIRQAAVILTVLLAVIFLKERNNLGRTLAAALLVTAGVVLLS